MFCRRATSRILFVVAPVCTITPFRSVVVCEQSVPSFTEYAVLGNDVLIADEAVALVYHDLLLGLGVKISKQKSPISRSS